MKRKETLNGKEHKVSTSLCRVASTLRKRPCEKHEEQKQP